jgi:pimeloyl-ACP methyl ester carboxylesterase
MSHDRSEECRLNRPAGPDAAGLWDRVVRVIRLVVVVTPLVATAACGGATPSLEPTITEPEPTAMVRAAPSATPEPDGTKPPSAPEPTQTVEEIGEQVPRFEPDQCPFDVPSGAAVECGFVVVPEDHDDPSGSTIRLAVVIIRDRSEDHQPDPVLLLAGGPGEKTVANAPAVADLIESIHPRRDLIIFDQRGVGLSEPALECPEWEQVLFDLLDEPDPNVSAESGFEAMMACRDRLVAEGRKLSAYTTRQNAADVDAIRAALGYDHVNLHGGSYGSLLAQATMRDHPESIRSVVMNSVVPLEKSLFIDTSTVATEGVLRLVEACASDEACDGAYPDLEGVLFEVIDRLNEAPVPITVTNPLDGQSYAAVLTGDAVFGNFVATLYQTPLIPALPQAIYDVYEGNYQLMTTLRSLNLVFFEAISRGMQFSVMCTDDLVGRTPQDLLNLQSELPRQLRGRADPELAIEYGVFGMCENWPVKQADPSVKDPLVSEIPTLVLEGEFDPVTPSAYAKLVAGHLPNSYVYEFPGIGHDLITASECARSVTGDFIEDPTRPPDADCIPDMPGVAFDVPADVKPVVLEPFVDEGRGFQGLIPVGWQELAPANLLRANSSLDPTYFVIAAEPVGAEALFANLAEQLAIDPELGPVSTAEIGQFIWSFYTFERRGYPADLALAEDDRRAYFVLLLSAADERDFLYEELFMPAVEAIAPVD